MKKKTLHAEIIVTKSSGNNKSKALLKRYNKQQRRLSGCQSSSTSSQSIASCSVRTNNTSCSSINRDNLPLANLPLNSIDCTETTNNILISEENINNQQEKQQQQQQRQTSSIIMSSAKQRNIDNNNNDHHHHQHQIESPCDLISTNTITMRSPLASIGDRDSSITRLRWREAPDLELTSHFSATSLGEPDKSCRLASKRFV